MCNDKAKARCKRGVKNTKNMREKNKRLSSSVHLHYSTFTIYILSGQSLLEILHVQNHFCLWVSAVFSLIFILLHDCSVKSNYHYKSCFAGTAARSR